MNKIILFLIAVLVIIVFILVLVFGSMRQQNNPEDQLQPGAPKPTAARIFNNLFRRPSPTRQPSQADRFQTFVKSFPTYETTDFKAYYSPELNKMILVKKTAKADEEIKKWAQSRGIQDLLNDKNKFITTSQPNLTDLQKNKLNALRPKLPLFTPDFNVRIDSDGTIIIEKKTPQADEKIKQWIIDNDLSDIVNTPETSGSVIISNPNPTPTPNSQNSNGSNQNGNNNSSGNTGGNNGNTNIPTSGINAGTITRSPTIKPPNLLTATPSKDQLSLNKHLDTSLEIIFNSIPTITPTPSPTPIDNSGSNSGGGENNGGGSSTTPPPANEVPDVTSLDFAAWGLPKPKAEDSGGARGYERLKRQLESNNNARWAATQMLAGEREAKGRGFNVIRYLNTAWLWFENGSASWPDPYQVNCNDDRPGFTSTSSSFCSVRNFQISGYQAATRQNDYVRVFKTFYSDSQLKSVMQQVVDNSSKASQAKWKYNGETIPSNISLNTISPNKDFFNQEAQKYTLILGKDPKISAALNSYAVSNGDLIRALKNQSCAYNYICATEKQILSNMVAALYIFEKGSLPSSGGGSSSSSSGGNTSSGGTTLGNFTHYCQCDPQWQSKGDKCICNSGCGLTTIAAGMTSLGVRTTPPEVRSSFEGSAWRCDVGLYSQIALQSNFLRQKGFKPVMTNLTQGGTVNVNLARKFFEGENKNKCFLLASNKDLYHIFAISGIDGNNLVVHDSWKGCKPGSREEDPSFRIQKPNYANQYAYPICKL